MKTKILILTLLISALCLSGCKETVDGAWYGKFTANVKIIDKDGKNLLKDIQFDIDGYAGSNIEVWDTQQDTMIFKLSHRAPMILIDNVPCLHFGIDVLNPKICPPSITFKVKWPDVFGNDDTHHFISDWEYFGDPKRWGAKWIGCKIDGVDYPITNVAPSDYSYVTLVIDKQ